MRSTTPLRHSDLAAKIDACPSADAAEKEAMKSLMHGMSLEQARRLEELLDAEILEVAELDRHFEKGREILKLISVMDNGGQSINEFNQKGDMDFKFLK